MLQHFFEIVVAGKFYSSEMQWTKSINHLLRCSPAKTTDSLLAQWQTATSDFKPVLAETGQQTDVKLSPPDVSCCVPLQAILRTLEWLGWPEHVPGGNFPPHIYNNFICGEKTVQSTHTVHYDMDIFPIPHEMQLAKSIALYYALSIGSNLRTRACLLYEMVGRQSKAVKGE